MIKHTFAICAYKESPYLEECIQSLKKQKLRSNIIMVTSTPNEHIKFLADKYAVPIYVNEGESGITQDWNFALSKVETKYATVAHQDDIYEENYSYEIVKQFEHSGKPLIAFTDYSEIRNGEKVYDVPMLRIKRKMLLPFKVRAWRSSKFIRRRILALGDPICCPSVAFCLDNIAQPIFDNHFRSCEDWEAWEKISRLDGDFIYIPESMMAHRIHEGSATTAIIADNDRTKEDFEMFCRFWPKWVAIIIEKFYCKSENSNQI